MRQHSRSIQRLQVEIGFRANYGGVSKSKCKSRLEKAESEPDNDEEDQQDDQNPKQKTPKRKREPEAERSKLDVHFNVNLPGTASGSSSASSSASSSSAKQPRKKRRTTVSAIKPRKQVTHSLTQESDGKPHKATPKVHFLSFVHLWCNNSFLFSTLALFLPLSICTSSSRACTRTATLGWTRYACTANNAYCPCT